MLTGDGSAVAPPERARSLSTGLPGRAPFMRDSARRGFFVACGVRLVQLPEREVLRARRRAHSASCSRPRARPRASASHAFMPPCWTIQRPGRLGDLPMVAAGIKLAATGQRFVVLRELTDDLGGVCFLRGHPVFTTAVANRTVTMLTTARLYEAPSFWQLWSARSGHFVPQPAIQVDVVSAGLTGSGIADVSVKGMVVIGDLGCSA